jgi:hypothetical protein
MTDTASNMFAGAFALVDIALVTWDLTLLARLLVHAS